MKGVAMNIKLLPLISAVALGLSLAPIAHAETTAQKLKRLEAELNTLADAVDNKSGGSGALSRTKVGGYGELHYNNIDGKDAAIDFHRFVLFVSHDFNDRMRFFSEFEIEHALSGNGKPGEVEIEQAYVEMDINNNLSAKAGLFLVPVGLINETHEPPVFYGVERNPLEKNIIPATWWEAGLGLSGKLGNRGLSYDAAFTSGLEVDPTSVNMRKGRQKVAKATAENFAFTGRLKYTGIPGLELAGTVQIQDDITQAKGDDVGGAVLTEVHAALKKGKFGAIAQYAQWDIDITNAALKNKEKQDGYLLEGSYKFTPKIGAFARQVGWSNEAGKDKEQQNFGINYWPHEDIVFKADIQQQNDDAGNGDGFNLGVGYQF